VFPCVVSVCVGYGIVYLVVGLARLQTCREFGLVEDVLDVIITRVGAASEGREVVSGVDFHVAVLIYVCVSMRTV
jgi:hypothetical protein